MKNKILYITNQAPHYRIPVFNELAKKLDIKFVFTHENKKIDGLDANYILMKGFGKGKYKIHFELNKILEKEKPLKVVMLPPDPLHLIDNLILYRWCKKNKVPYVMTVGRWEYKNTSLKQRLTEPFFLKILKKAEYCFTYGTKSEEWLINRKIPKDKIIKTYNINPEIYKNFNEKKNKLHELENKKVILFVGRLIERKGIDYLIKAFSEIKDKNVVLVIGGGGDFYKLGAKSEESKLKNLVKKLDLKDRVIFAGSISPEETKKYYKSADIFVCPSITLSVSEAWGHVVEEAMSFGLPVITTDAVGASYDLIEEGKNGFIAKERSSEELKNAMEEILNNKKLMNNMGKKSKEIITSEKFSFDSIIKNWEKGLK